ncbi:RNA-directed DNA polymerase from mobile element jockey-like [Rhizophagus clarus]|uniref:RNA-directed DNA polymerase from mobile element jockey-like n=1 Tax=Rhizophagus clarus TaxID=94130 RepID=A0A8H3QTH0_9GLOM|nr:RNA-directed DNA polymerase from mobile element jockey-like [Rhizophagus clarus]
MITKSKNTNIDFDDRSTNGIKKIIEFTTRKYTRHDGSINDNRTELSIIMSRHNIAYTNNNIRNKTSNFLHKLQSTLATLEAKFYHEYYKYHKWLIESFVDKRNDNYKNDKKKMINSITEKHIKSITIDKVYCNDNDEDILYTNVQDVQEQTNLHFQRVAEDWIETINNLPNDKASGPSGISYEMLKHLNIINQSIFHAFICVCIDLGTIPDAWKKAMVYPIPKPKPFFVSLTNTRPITLLETSRKAFINLGKAYDRVNIFMLEKAMNRLKIPSLFTRIITSLFKNRTNQVITAYGLTDPYEVIIGIDQGEVILPLLWCIYYDPLLCEVESRKLGYTISAPSISLNNNPCDDSNQVEEDSLTISSIAFIDDTQWLAPDKSNLESILKIADSFYRLTDIQVNKEKSSLLLRKKRFDKSKLRPHNPIQLDFGFDTITITPTSPFESTRILAKFARKRIIDKHMIYIFNHVFIPRIEFWTQLKILPPNFMEQTMHSFFNTFKKQLKLSVSIPDAIFNEHLYNFRKIQDNQMQAKVTNILLQLNDQSLMGPSHITLKWYNNLINNLNNNTEALRILNQTYGQQFDSAPLKFNQFSVKSERIRKEKNHSAKPILVNADNRNNPFIDTPAKRTNFNDITFDLEHYNIISHIGNHMEIQRCEGCDDTTSFFSPSRPHRHQQPASYCNVNVLFNNTAVLYTGTTSKGLNSRIILVNQNTYNNVLSTIPTTFLSQQQHIQSPRPINQSVGYNILSSSLDLTNNNNNFLSSESFFHNFELNAKSEELFVI